MRTDNNFTRETWTRQIGDAEDSQRRRPCQTADNYGLSRGSVTQNGHRCQQTETESSTERQTANHKPTARFWHASICYTTEMEPGQDF